MWILRWMPHIGSYFLETWKNFGSSQNFSFPLRIVSEAELFCWVRAWGFVVPCGIAGIFPASCIEVQHLGTAVENSVAGRLMLSCALKPRCSRSAASEKSWLPLGLMACQWVLCHLGCCASKRRKSLIGESSYRAVCFWVFFYILICMLSLMFQVFGFHTS